MAHYLFKTEPDEYSYADLARDKRTVWDGVTNALALIHLRAVRKGDAILVYHTGGERAAVGVAEAVSNARPDPRDPAGRRVVVDVRAVRALPAPATLAAFKSDPVLATSDLVRLPRLGVVPLTAAQWARALALAGA